MLNFLNLITFSLKLIDQSFMSIFLFFSQIIWIAKFSLNRLLSQIIILTPSVPPPRKIVSLTLKWLQYIKNAFRKLFYIILHIDLLEIYQIKFIYIFFKTWGFKEFIKFILQLRWFLSHKYCSAYKSVESIFLIICPLTFSLSFVTYTWVCLSINQSPLVSWFLKTLLNLWLDIIDVDTICFKRFFYYFIFNLLVRIKILSSSYEIKLIFVFQISFIDWEYFCQFTWYHCIV